MRLTEMRNMLYIIDAENRRDICMKLNHLLLLQYRNVFTQEKERDGELSTQWP